MVTSVSTLTASSVSVHSQLPADTLATCDSSAEVKTEESNSSQVTPDSVVVTLDSHQVNHIAHGSFWEKPDDAAARPLPFTVISVEDVAAGKWRARDPALRDWARAYVEALAKGGRFARSCGHGPSGSAMRRRKLHRHHQFF